MTASSTSQYMRYILGGMSVPIMHNGKQYISGGVSVRLIVCTL